MAMAPNQEPTCMPVSSRQLGRTPHISSWSTGPACPYCKTPLVPCLALPGR